MKHNEVTERLLTERFGKDSLIALATVDDGVPHVRTVDGVYIDGAFYVVTYHLSGKMQQIAKNPVVAISGEWFTAHVIGQNLGHVLLPENSTIMKILRDAFAAWYDNGHTNEGDSNTCLLKIKLTDAVLFAEGKRYDIEFGEIK